MGDDLRRVLAPIIDLLMVPSWLSSEGSEVHDLAWSNAIWHTGEGPAIFHCSPQTSRFHETCGCRHKPLTLQLRHVERASMAASMYVQICIGCCACCVPQHLYPVHKSGTTGIEHHKHTCTEQSHTVTLSLPSLCFWAFSCDLAVPDL